MVMVSPAAQKGHIVLPGLRVLPGAVILTEGTMLTPGDIIYILFLVICIWLAVNIDDSGGGGKRARIPA